MNLEIQSKLTFIKMMPAEILVGICAECCPSEKYRSLNAC